MKKNMNKKGFTIVELVIVIAVIAILAAVLIPTFVSLVSKANLSADKQAVTQMNTALAAETGVDSLEKAIDALSAAGYNAADTLVPVTKDHAFYWNKTHNAVVLVKGTGADATAVWPEETKFTDNFAVEFAKTGDAQVYFSLADGAKYIDVATTNPTTFSAALALGNNNVAITEDMTIAQSAIVLEGSTVAVDLGGKTLSTAADSNEKHAYAISASGDVTLSNGTINSRGTYVYNKMTVEEGTTINAIDKDGGSAINVKSGELLINGGTFTALNGDAKGTAGEDLNAEPSIIKSEGNVTIKGGTFEAKSYSYSILANAGAMVIDGGDFSSTRGVVAVSGGTLEINGGKFTKTENLSSSHTVYAEDDAQVVVNAGEFTCPEGSGIYAFYAAGNSTITVKAGVVVNGRTLVEDVVLNSTNRTLK